MSARYSRFSFDENLSDGIRSVQIHDIRDTQIVVVLLLLLLWFGEMSRAGHLPVEPRGRQPGPDGRPRTRRRSGQSENDALSIFGLAHKSPVILGILQREHRRVDHVDRGRGRRRFVSELTVIVVDLFTATSAQRK